MTVGNEADNIGLTTQEKQMKNKILKGLAMMIAGAWAIQQILMTLYSVYSAIRERQNNRVKDLEDLVLSLGEELEKTKALALSHEEEIEILSNCQKPFPEQEFVDLRSVVVRHMDKIKELEESKSSLSTEDIICPYSEVNLSDILEDISHQFLEIKDPKMAEKMKKLDKALAAEVKPTRKKLGLDKKKTKK